VIAGGVRPVDADDAASEILIKFIEKDALSWYDPNKVHHKALDGTVVNKTASFKTLLRRFVSLYNRQCRDRQFSRDKREAVRLDSAEAPDLIVSLAPYQPRNDAIENLLTVDAAQVLLREIRGQLALIPWGLESFATVFDAAIEAYLASETDTVTSAGLAATLDVPVKTAREVLPLLREHLHGMFPGPVLGYLG